MIDINLIRNNKELVIDNIKKKFQDHKIVLVDEILELDKKVRRKKQIVSYITFTLGLLIAAIIENNIISIYY